MVFRDEKRKRTTMTDFHAEMSAEHATPAMRFVTARYPLLGNVRELAMRKGMGTHLYI